MAEAATQHVDIPIEGGVDAYTAPERVAPPKWLLHEDGSLHQPGSISQRNAYALMSDQAEVDGVVDVRPAGFSKLIKDRGALLAIGAEDSRAYELSENEDRWALVDRAAVFPVTERRDVLGHTRASSLDIARVSGWLMVTLSNHALSGSSRSLITVLLDENDLVARSHMADAWIGEAPVREGGVKVVGVEDRYFVAAWVVGTSVRCSAFDTQAVEVGWSAPTTIGTTHATALDFDMTSFASSALVVWSAATLLAVARVVVSSGAPVLAAGPVAVTGSAVSDGGGIAIAVDPDSWHSNALLCYCNSAVGIGFSVVNRTTLALVTGALVPGAALTSIANLTALTYGNEAGVDTGVVCYTNAGTMESAIRAFTLSPAAPGVLLTYGLAQGATKLKPFRRRGLDIFGLAYEQTPSIGSALTNQEPTVYLVPRLDLDQGIKQPVIGRMLPFTADIFYDALGAPKGVTSIVRGADENTYYTVLFEPAIPLIANVLGNGFVAVFKINFAADVAARAIEFDGSAVVAGSVPRRYERDALGGETPGVSRVGDPRGFVGLAPFHSPKVVGVAGLTTGGGLTLLGTYLYRFTYQYVSRDGRRIHSLPSVALPITLTGTEDAVIVTTLPPGASPGMDAGLRTVVWRTTANATEPIYYLVGIETGVDTLADTELEQRPILYTVSGELENESPPPSLALALWKGRIAALNSESYEIWYSKSVIAGELSGFSSALVIDTQVHTSKPIYISSHGGRLIVWWSDAIGVVEGEPASDTGVGGTVQPPYVFAHGVGLAERGSLLETPIGTFFRSRRGLQLLGLDLSVTFIGADVSGTPYVMDEEGDAPTAIVPTPPTPQRRCMDAVHIESKSEVRFVFDNEPHVVVYNLERQQWHVHLLGEAVSEGEPLTPSIASAVRHGDQLVVCWESAWKAGTRFAWIDNVVGGSDPASTGRPFLRLRTGWIHFGGIMSSPRVRRFWLLGHFAAGSAIDIEYDYIETVVETKSPNTEGALGMVEVELPTQACMAVRFTLRGLARLVALRSEVEIEKGTYKRRSTRV